MATNDVPGANPANGDSLSMGCWAEHEDGTLIFVENTEGGRVIYSVFDLSRKPPIEYRDAMPIEGFKKRFTWKKDVPDSMLFRWHDKSAFPWDRVIEKGIPDGVRHACAEHQISAAQQIAERRSVIGKPVDPEKYEHMRDRLAKAGEELIGGIQRAISRLRL